MKSPIHKNNLYKKKFTFDCQEKTEFFLGHEMNSDVYMDLSNYKEDVQEEISLFVLMFSYNKKYGWTVRKDPRNENVPC